MRKKIRQIVAIGLAVLNIVSVSPVSALASEVNNEIVLEETNLEDINSEQFTESEEVVIPEEDAQPEEVVIPEEDVQPEEVVTPKEIAESEEEADSDDSRSFKGENPYSNEVITGMDENGNIYEVAVETPDIQGINPYARALEPSLVCFSGYVEYKEFFTGEDGYTSGSYGMDALYLGTTSDGQIKFMLSGVIGKVAASKVSLVPLSKVKSMNHYQVNSAGNLIHYITKNVTGTEYFSTLNNGPAPSYLSSGVKYLSYDGHYFYKESQYSVMQSDFNAGHRNNAINASAPFFNYFQYLPLRSYTKYSAAELSSIINAATESGSKMKDIGSALVQHQNTYGTNALLMAAISANESNWGRSRISKDKNNLFGIGANDSDPYNAAYSYSTVSDCLAYYSSTMLSKQYLNPNNWKYFGGFLGNKESGMNVKYASDPYWGEKAAAIAWKLDSANSNKDAGKYTIGIKSPINAKATDVNVRSGASTGSAKVHTTGSQSAQAFIILDKTPVNNFYKIQSDGVLNSARTAIDSSTGVYNASQMHLYISADYVSLLSNTLDSDNGSGNDKEEIPDKEVVFETGFVNETQKEYKITIKNYDLPAGASFRAAVWSEAGGQDDLRWNVLKEQADGTLQATVRVSDYKSPGKYLVHVYYYNSAGSAQFYKSVSFEVDSLPNAKVEVEEQNKTTGKALLKVSGMEVPSGVAKVRIAVWSASNQSDIYWYDAKKGEDAWYVEMDLSKHKNNWSVYSAHVYATDGNGFQKYVGGISVDFRLNGMSPELMLDKDSGKLTVAFPNLSVPSGMTAIRFAVWSEQNGQDDVMWYSITEAEDKWEKTIPLSFLKSAGKSLVHVYAVNKNGNLAYLGANSFMVEAPTLEEITVWSDNDTGEFEIAFDAPVSTSSVKKVEVEIWSKSDKSDVKCYEAKKQADGSYKVSSDISAHNYNIGTYQIHVHVTDGLGFRTDVQNANMEFKSSVEKVLVTEVSKELLYNMGITVNSYPAGLKEVQFAVWSESGGQNDLKWYTAAETEGTYSYTLDIRNHKTTGKYQIHVYGVDRAGRKVFLGGTSDLFVAGVPTGTLSVTEKNDRNGTFKLVVSDLMAPSGIDTVKVAAWTTVNGQDDICWYTCKEQGDGTYVAEINAKNHKYNVGEYLMHVYVTMGNQIQNYFKGITYKFEPVNYLYVLKDQGNGKRTVGLHAANAKDIRFAVWSDENGQNDLVWYTAKQEANGAWKATVDSKNHKEGGTFHVHAYAGNTPVVTDTFEMPKSEFPKNGWYYEVLNGKTYKLYYEQGVLKTDVTDIVGPQSSYRAEVNRTTCTVTIYAKDGTNGYIIPVKVFACSVGLPDTPTPTGTFYTSEKYRWHELMGPSYGQYCTRIVGGILFHSVAGSNMTSYNLSAYEYNRLGQPASHGCVRLCVRDAKWIYDNCRLGMEVRIYDSSYPGPLGKPATIKIPASQNWDPTDPNI